MKATVRNLLVVTAAVLLAAASLAAQKLPIPVDESPTPSNYTESPVKADIAGRVVPAAGFPLPERVLVRLETHTGMLLQRTWTGRGGNFQFSHIVCGFYVLAVDVPGYNPVRVAIEHSFIPAEGVMLRLTKNEGAAEEGEATAATPETLNPLRAEAAREFQKGLAQFAEEKFDASIRHFRKTIQVDPTFEEAYLQLGLVYLQQREPAKAQSVLEDATLRNPRNPRALALLGRAFRLQSQWEKAAAALQRSVEIKDDFWIAQLELGQTLVAMGKHPQAFPHLQRAHQLNPREASSHHLLYNALIRSGDYRTALDELDEFLRLFPKHPLAEKARAQREALSKEVTRTARN